MMDAKLATFIRAAELKSFTRAAETLNLTQPAVTQHIRLLEEHYDVKLFRKKGRQICLTEEGELLFGYAKEFEADCLVLERKLKNKSSVAKRYVIGATLTIGEFVLPNMLGEYKKLHDNIDVIMHVYNLEEVVTKLGNGGFDLGIVEGPFDKNRFGHKKLKEDELLLVASPGCNLFGKPEVRIEEVLGGDKLILREKGSGTRMVFENKLRELGCAPGDLKIYMEVGSIGAIKSLVAANLGYTVISREAVRKELEEGTLVAIPVAGVKFTREFNFIYSDRAPREFIDEFMGFLIRNTRDS